MYASPQPSTRKFLWDKLDALAVEIPWALIGDFNCILTVEERSSSSGVPSSFQSWVYRNGLVELGFVGSRYTWSHRVSIVKRRAARLDRAVCRDK